MPTRDGSRPAPAAIVSLHDVMPETLSRVIDLLGLLESHGLGPVDLLVVPGRAWRPAQIDQLRAWQGAGHRLAGHGWRHKVERIRGWKHRLHSRLVSRDVAEHLALDAEGIAALIRRCHAWFGAHDLMVSDLYVPPAWAMGPLARARLRDLPFRRYEVFGGLLDARTGRLSPSPMVGFEADTWGRVWPVRLFNGANRAWAAASGAPLRVGLHPFDLEYRLGGDLRRLITRLGAGPA
ncbi:polysaccharide deacetylase family protein [Roseospira visakhapatnamensis]|uniref:DUF2334 domain-containing protein n=1 Tax=Roseospira visakhapatnamensis TaxID=390880 RepID=A0A7W6RDI1_9PROT|nr:polysaccharide deacetylase family protein [Roseospira visakhapatnamensis]MBB4266452.1 hypothetical protein [Roseospira visakhapatnamensis]